jgi:hypothetical protein
MNALATTLRKMGRHEEAVALHEKLLELWHLMNANGDGEDRFYLIPIAVTCQAAGKLDLADRVLHERLEIDRKRGDSIGRLERAITLGWLARTRLLQRRYPEGERFAREALAIFEEERPDDGRRFYWMTILGSLLAGQGRLPEAESHLLQGYQGMRSSDTAAILERNWRLRDVCERITQYYEMTNQPDQARVWRGRLPP